MRKQNVFNLAGSQDSEGGELLRISNQFNYIRTRYINESHGTIQFQI